MPEWKKTLYTLRYHWKKAALGLEIGLLLLWLLCG